MWLSGANAVAGRRERSRNGSGETRDRSFLDCRADRPRSRSRRKRKRVDRAPEVGDLAAPAGRGPFEGVMALRTIAGGVCRCGHQRSREGKPLAAMEGPSRLRFPDTRRRLCGRAAAVKRASNERNHALRRPFFGQRHRTRNLACANRRARIRCASEVVAESGHRPRTGEGRT